MFNNEHAYKTQIIGCGPSTMDYGLPHVGCWLKTTVMVF